MAEGKIIFAVDFGTTFSGAAYAYVEKDDDPNDVEINLIEDHWPGMGSQSSQKVPSVFKYDKTAPGGFKWGFQLDGDPDRICFSKLYLDQRQIHAAETLASFSAKPGKLPPNRKVTDGIAKFLESIRAVAFDRMEADWGKDFIDSTPMESILTVPAVWSDKAKNDTLQCAVKAGFGDINKIRLIAEPEAAAVYTFHQLPEFFVQRGHVFITVDAGGGTVDLTTYQVYETKPTLRVEEIILGDGGLCGSVYLNRRFEDVVRRKIDGELGKLSRVKALEAIDDIQRVFDDDIKPNFGVSDEEKKEYEVPVPAEMENNRDLGIRDGKLVISTEEMKDVFDPVISSIVQLIIGQLERIDAATGHLKVAAILLVGGFGSSEYLRKYIENHFSGEDGMPAIKVIQPMNAWSAVTRGAMLRGIQGDVVETRIIRHHYGVVSRTLWNVDIHEKGDKRRQAEQNKYFDATEQKLFCSNVMTWYVKKGDKFSSKRIITFDFYRAITNLNNLVFNTDLIVYTGRGGETPYFVDSDCRTVATLSADLSSIPHSQFDVMNSGNGEWYKVSYDIEMTFETTINFRLKFKGKVMGECLGVEYRG